MVGIVRKRAAHRKRKEASRLILVVFVTCQLGGRGDEGQPGFILVLVKAVLVHQWFQSSGLE
jgi:hypothetical protein